MEERVWIKHYFSVHFATNIGNVKLSTNVAYGRNGLSGQKWLVHYTFKRTKFVHLFIRFSSCFASLGQEMRYIFEFLFFCTQISSQMFKYNISEYVFQIPNCKALRRHSENMSWPGIVLKTIRSERIKIILSAL